MSRTGAPCPEPHIRKQHMYSSIPMKPILNVSSLRRPQYMLLLIPVIDSRVKRWILCDLFSLTGQSPIVICFGAFFHNLHYSFGLTTCLCVIRPGGERLIKVFSSYFLKWNYQHRYHLAITLSQNNCQRTVAAALEVWEGTETFQFTLRCI